MRALRTYTGDIWAYVVGDDRGSHIDTGGEVSNDFEPKRIAIVEVYPDGKVAFIGSWVTHDVTTQDYQLALMFNKHANDLGFAAAISAARCDDVRILPYDEAVRMYEEQPGRARK